MPVDQRTLTAAYLRAKRAVIAAGYESEIAWQETACDAPLTERRFLSEAAWVVLSSGMRESVVRRVFPKVAAAFSDFATARDALHAAVPGRRVALRVFHHPGKIDAIIAIIRRVELAGIVALRHQLETNGVGYLRTFPYMGPVTALHLAKNLGCDVVKPDRHLKRIAHACGYADPLALCIRLRGVLGEPLAVVDIVFWRFATLFANYLKLLLPGAGATSAYLPVRSSSGAGNAACAVAPP